MGVTATHTSYGFIHKVRFGWIASTSGAASGATDEELEGEIIGLTTVPSSTAVPTASYDITITDADGDDVLLGQGANRSDTATEHVARTSLAAVASSKLTLNVSSAGNTTAGTVIIYVR